ncbi:anthrone oxygenase family protein [Flindersiella endophytica]
MERLRVVTLLAATITMGLVTGAFALYAHTIMPGLARTDDRTFVGAFQATDRAILNPWFLGVCFFGALILTVLATVTHIGHRALPWIAAALVLYVIAVVITFAVNVPLNDAIEAAGDPGKIDVAAVREQFDEAKWAAWNLVRTVASVIAFGLLAWALTLPSRQS